MLLLLLVLWGKKHMHVYFLCVYMIYALCSSLSLFVLRWSRGHVTPCLERLEKPSGCL